MDTNQRFIDLLEQYVFNAASKIIDLVDKKEQGELIDFVVGLGKSSTDSNSPARSLRKVDTELLVAKSPTESLKKQWEEVLSVPFVQKSIYSEKRHLLISRSIKIDQHEIDQTVLCIRSVEKLLARAEKNINNNHLKADVVSHYESLKLRYAARITQLETFRREKLSKLEQ